MTLAAKERFGESFFTSSLQAYFPERFQQTRNSPDYDATGRYPVPIPSKRSEI